MAAVIGILLRKSVLLVLHCRMIIDIRNLCGFCIFLYQFIEPDYIFFLTLYFRAPLEEVTWQDRTENRLYLVGLCQFAH